MKRLFKGTRCKRTVALLMAVALLSAFLPSALAVSDSEPLSNEVKTQSIAPGTVSIFGFTFENASQSTHGAHGTVPPENHDYTATTIAAIVSLLALSGIVFILITTKKQEVVPEINEN